VARRVYELHRSGSFRYVLSARGDRWPVFRVFSSRRMARVGLEAVRMADPGARGRWSVLRLSNGRWALVRRW